jgi:hypothetical protein
MIYNSENHWTLKNFSKDLPAVDYSRFGRNIFCLSAPLRMKGLEQEFSCWILLIDTPHSFLMLMRIPK